MTDKVRTEFWADQIEDVRSEIARKATICDVQLLEPGISEAVLLHNSAACGSTSLMAFKKLRAHMQTLCRFGQHLRSASAPTPDLWSVITFPARFRRFAET